MVEVVQAPEGLSWCVGERAKSFVLKEKPGAAWYRVPISPKWILTRSDVGLFCLIVTLMLSASVTLIPVSLCGLRAESGVFLGEKREYDAFKFMRGSLSLLILLVQKPGAVCY